MYGIMGVHRYTVPQLIEALCYKLKGRGFDEPDMVIGIFH